MIISNSIDIQTINLATQSIIFESHRMHNPNKQNQKRLIARSAIWCKIIFYRICARKQRCKATLRWAIRVHTKSTESFQIQSAHWFGNERMSKELKSKYACVLFFSIVNRYRIDEALNLDCCFFIIFPSNDPKMSNRNWNGNWNEMNDDAKIYAK